MNSSSNPGGNLGLAHFQYPSAGDSEDDTTDCAPPVLEQLSRALLNSQMSYLQRKHSNIWSAHLMDLGLAEQYCLHSHNSPAILYQTTLRDSGVIHLLNKLLNLLQIQGFAPLGFSQQYEDQQDTPNKVFYVEGAWCCNFLFRVEATQRDLQDEWTSVEVRVCSASLLSARRQARLPTIVQTATSLDAPWKSIPWRHPGEHAIFSELVLRSDPCLTMHDFPDRSGTSLQPPVGHTRRGGAPEHQRSEAASLPRASSPRVVSCPTSGAGQMRDSELFV